MQPTAALVWFKRDLRLHDHAPLVGAQAHTHALGLFVIEPEWLQSPECDASHVDSALACQAELRAALAQRGMSLLVGAPFKPRVGPWAQEVVPQEAGFSGVAADSPSAAQALLGLAPHGKTLQDSGEIAAHRTLL